MKEENNKEIAIQLDKMINGLGNYAFNSGVVGLDYTRNVYATRIKSYIDRICDQSVLNFATLVRAAYEQKPEMAIVLLEETIAQIKTGKAEKRKKL